MEILKSLLALLIILAIIVRISKKQQRRSSQLYCSTYNENVLQKVQYRPVGKLLTNCEQNFFKYLEPAVKSNQLKLYLKVRIADIIVPVGEIRNKKWWKDFKFISQKHIDFLCVDEFMNPIIAIELNDRSHEEEGRADRDKMIKKAFEDSGVPLIFVLTSNTYNEKSLWLLLNKFTKKVPK